MEDLKNVLKGMLIGISNVIPGVSAGTTCVILEIYDKLIYSISNIFKDFKKNFKFLFFIGIGVLIGILFFSNVMEELLNNYPWNMNYLFIGLIIGSVNILFKTIFTYKPKKNDYIYFIITLTLLIVLRFITPINNVKVIAELNFSNVMLLIISGFIAAGTMILPGISGAFILILLGMYNSVISAVSNFNIIFLIPFGIGVILGFVIMVKLLEFLLRRFKLQTYMAILGLVIGSVFSIFPGFEFSLKGLSCIGMFLIGFFISFFVSRVSKKNG